MPTFDQLVQQFIDNLKLALSQMEADEDGNIEMSMEEFGMTITAVALGQAMSMGTSVDQLKQVIARCFHEPEPESKPQPKIILS